MSFRYHGNWCGPGWSDGRYVDSTNGFAPAIDEFDESCRQHDFALVGGARNRAADEKFFNENIGKGPKRMVAALAVAVRDRLQLLSDPPPLQNKMKKNLRTNKTKNSGQSNSTPTLKKNDQMRAAPIAIATRRTGSTPKVTTSPSGVTITHRSFLFPVTNSAAFSALSIPCNPGLSGSFPWLGKLARRYEQYRFKKLRYEFRSVSASTKTGVIMMSFDYDAADLAPATKAEQAQTIPNTETNVWMNNDLDVRPDGGWHFVRSGTLASNLDIKTYDMGNMWLSSAYGDGLVGGELYVEYTVELRRPTDGPEVGGRFACETGSFAAPINATNPVVSGVAFPFSRVDNNNFLVTAGGEYFMSMIANGTTLTGAFALPTIASISTTSVIGPIDACTQANVSVRNVRVRCETGDIINFANAGTGAAISNTRVYVSPIDYTSFAP